jgi:glutamate racemase
MTGAKAIGIIDSGVGGLTVAREVIRQLPRETIVYFGDNARCPYGPRPAEEIRKFTLQMIRFVRQFPLKALVIACNTASAVVLEEVQQTSDIPVLGVIQPGARAAITASQTGRIGVIGTDMTIRSGAYERELLRLKPELFVTSLACPALVPLVEQDLLQTEKAETVVGESLFPLHAQDIDTLVLGCTHYPLLAPLIARALGEEIRLISSAEETARELSTLFSIHRLHAPTDVPVSTAHRFYTSGDERVFRNIAQKWLEIEVDVQHVNLSAIPTEVPVTGKRERF